MLQHALQREASSPGNGRHPPPPPPPQEPPPVDASHHLRDQVQGEGGPADWIEEMRIWPHRSQQMRPPTGQDNWHLFLSQPFGPCAAYGAALGRLLLPGRQAPQGQQVPRRPAAQDPAPRGRVPPFPRDAPRADEVAPAARRLLTAEHGHRVYLMNCTSRAQIIATLQAAIREGPVQDAVARAFHRTRLHPPTSVPQRLEQLLDMAIQVSRAV